MGVLSRVGSITPVQVILSCIKEWIMEKDRGQINKLLSSVALYSQFLP